MALLGDILSYCESRLQLSDIPDFPGAQNGLQFENNGQVNKIGAAVDAGLIPFQKAVVAGVDFLIVHHGLFWGPAYPVTGLRYEKYKLCLENNLAVFSVHLPLDSHPEIGNNALVSKKLGLQIARPFLEHEGHPVGLIADGGITRDELKSRLTDLFPMGFTAVEKGSAQPSQIAILTGSGESAVTEILKPGIDTLITGELKQHHYNIAEESGLNLYLCGHYATETFGVSSLAQEIAQKFGLEWEFIPSDCPI